MKKPRIDIASIRRQEIIEAAVAAIAEQGFQNLSLSEIEQRAGMSRGQLTYYFPTKEEILLGVFDRLLLLMYQRIGTPGGQEEGEAQESGWEWVKHLLTRLTAQPPEAAEFHCLQYTFLSQIGHREDLRRRLAALYEEWRSKMGEGLADDMNRRPPLRPVSPRTVATLVQALLHGLAMQQAADPAAFRRDEMVSLCLDVLGTYLWGRSWARPTRRTAGPTTKPGKGRRPASRALAKEVNGEHSH